MFTGLIQQVGKLAGKKASGKSLQLIINSEAWNPPLSSGESMAVNGVCLTVARLINQGFACDVLEETGRCTNLASQKIGAPLNLERALQLGAPLGGHLLSGHVEGLGRIIRLAPKGRDWQMRVACAAAIRRYIVPKGAIACDGISLTIAALEKTSFAVNIIPFTWRNTNLCYLREGATLNLETDLIGKYVFRWLEEEQSSEVIPLRQGYGGQGGQRSGEKPDGVITEDILRQAGFGE